MRPLTPEAAKAILACETAEVVDLADESPFETFDRMELILVVGAGFEDHSVTLEDGTTQATFIASGLDVSLPARNASGQQRLARDG